jgi:hypothetical protein
MAVIGNLVANISANATGFFTAMSAVGSVVESTGKAVGSAASGIGNAMGSMASNAGSASASIIRSMGSLTAGVARATGTLGTAFAKSYNDTRVASAKIRAVQEKTAAQINKMQAKNVKAGVFGGMVQFHVLAAGVRTVTNAVSGSLSAFRESEKAGKKLDAVLAATGGAAGVSGEEIRKMAGDLQLVTNFEDDATINAAALLATFTQIKGDTFQSAIVAAQDLSAVMGQDLNASIVQVGKALNDPVRGVTALRKVGVSFSEEQQKQIKQLQTSGDLAGAQAIILQELQNEFGGAARAVADPFTILSNVIGDIMEMLGGALLPTLQTIAVEVLGVFQRNTESIQAAFTLLGDIIKSVVFNYIRLMKIEFNLATVAVQNLGDIAQLVFLRVQLAAMTLGRVVAHFFMEELPAYFDWFLDNWRDIWTTAVNFVGTAFTNMGSNIADSMTEIWDYIASGGTDSLEMAWTPLLEGFENTIGELPKVAASIPSAVEAELETQAADLQEKLAAKFSEAIAPAVEEAVAPTIINAKEAAKKVVDDTEDVVATTRETGGVAALQAGSGEALSAILGAMRRESDQKEMLRLQQEQVELQREQLQATRDANDDDETVSIQ